MLRDTKGSRAMAIKAYQSHTVLFMTSCPCGEVPWAIYQYIVPDRAHDLKL